MLSQVIDGQATIESHLLRVEGRLERWMVGYADKYDAMAGADTTIERRKDRHETRSEYPPSPLMFQPLSSQIETPGIFEHQTSEGDGAVHLALPIGWPATLKPRQGLQYDRAASRKRNFARGMLVSPGNNAATLEKLLAPEVLVAAPKEPGGAMDPNSWTRVLFDLCALVVLFYDLTFTPYVVAWDVSISGALRVCAWITLLFWIADILISFGTGFYTEGELELRFEMVALRYLKTYFFLDITVVASELASLLLDASGPAVRVLVMLRILRLMRMLRFVRLVRIMKSVRLRSRRAQIIAHGLTFFLGVLWVAHMVACTWYGIGRFGHTDTGHHWADKLYDDLGKEPSLFYEYLTTYHFSMQLLAAGSMDVSPTNSVERQFTIITLTLGWFVGNSVVATLSTVMIELQMAVRDKTLKLELLQQFLDENGVSPEMAARVHSQVVNKLDRERRLGEDNVPCLDLLSPVLRSELSEHMYLPHLQRYPLFRVWAHVEPLAIRALVSKAVGMTPLAAGDVLFEAGAEANHIYWLVSGSLCYVQDPATSLVSERHATVLAAEGQCLCEAALWSQWIHVGMCEAVADSAVLRLHADSFAQVVGAHRGVRDLTLVYGQNFCERMKKLKAPRTSWPTDLEVPSTEYSELVMSMDFGLRKMVSMAALESMEESAWQRVIFSRRKSIEDLRSEVENGKCQLVQTSEGEVLRITAVTVLLLQHEHDEIFTQVGKRDRGILTVDCKLPGAKLEKGEKMDDAFPRMLDKVVGPLAGGILLKHTEREATWGTSEAFGIRTKYWRTINHAAIAPEFEIPGNSDKFLTVRLGTRALHIFTRESQDLLYMWLPAEDFQHFSSPAGKPALEAILAPLHGAVWRSGDGGSFASVEVPLLSHEVFYNGELPTAI